MEYLNTQTGEIVHAPIPKALHNEVSYGKNIKALAVMLNSDANVSVDKTIEIINEISNQEIKLSKGFVNNLNRKIAEVCEDELDEIFINLQRYKYMHIDATNVRVNGRNVNVFVTANPNNTLFYARESKGIKGVVGTAAENYAQILIHDHDRTFYNYGLNHQECLAHILRYLQSAIENEENLTWHKKMQSLLRKMIASVKEASLNTLSKAAYIIAYESILELSLQEYDKNPPSKYYREGFNLAKRLKAYQDSTLYFLEDEEVPYTNNLAERQLRKVKRKARVAGSFRSYEGLEYYCNVQSIIENTKTIGKSFFEHLKDVFSLEIGFNE
jgi:transposase-like protein